MSHRVLKSALSLIGLLLCSCSTASRISAKWVETPIDGPWIAPGLHAREFSRSYFAGLMHTSEATDTVWVTASDRQRDVSHFVHSAERFLKKLGHIDRWPESQSSVGGIRQRLAPFTFHIVAIDPTVVIMIPHDFGNPKGNRSPYDIVGQPPKQSFQSRYMLNYIEYGTRPPYHPDALWFSPDVGAAPSALTRRGDLEQEVTHKHIRIVLTKEGDSWTTRRE